MTDPEAGLIAAERTGYGSYADRTDETDKRDRSIPCSMRKAHEWQERCMATGC